MKVIVGGFASLLSLFIITTILFMFTKGNRIPVLIDISYNSGSHCARFPSLSNERCFEMVELPLSTWPYQSNRGSDN